MTEFNGIKDVYIQHHGECADPELIYKRGCFVCRCNYNDIIYGLPENMVCAFMRWREFVIGSIKQYGTWEKF